MNITNETPIEYKCSNGLVFKADRADLTTGVNVYDSYALPINLMFADHAEFGAWHALTIHPLLNGFAGYDAISFALFAGEESEDRKT